MMQIARVERIYDHGTNTQILCSDDWGLLSVYLEPKSFSRFHKMVNRTGLKLKGLSIEFSSNIVRIAGKGRKWAFCSAQEHARIL
jgi:hypothetical protein